MTVVGKSRWGKTAAQKRAQAAVNRRFGTGRKRTYYHTKGYKKRGVQQKFALNKPNAGTVKALSELIN